MTITTHLSNTNPSLKYTIQSSIDLLAAHYRGEDIHGVNGIVAPSIEELLRKGAYEVFAEIYRVGYPVVVRTHVEEFVRNELHGIPEVMYRLHYQLTVVQSENVRIPIFTFETITGEIKWKCPACGVLNDEKANFCGQNYQNTTGCGRPKGGL